MVSAVACHGGKWDKVGRTGKKSGYWQLPLLGITGGGPKVAVKLEYNEEFPSESHLLRRQ